MGCCLSKPKSAKTTLLDFMKFIEKDVNWDKKLDVENWEGVTFDDSGHVTRLGLEKASINGCLSDISEIIFGPHLCELDLSHNVDLTGQISTLVKCDGLLNLNLKGCKGIEGDLRDLNNCTKLVTLVLSECVELRGTLGALENCKNLTVANLYACRNINGTFEPLAGCIALETFSMSGGWGEKGMRMKTRIAGVLDPFGGCSALRTLDLESCEGLEGTLDAFQYTPCLQFLNLRYTSIKGTLAGLSSCKQLQDLNLRFCVDLEGTLAPLSQCTALRRLNLSRTAISGPIGAFGGFTGETYLRNCTKLKMVDVNNTRLLGSLTELEDCHSLLFLNIRQTRLTDVEEFVELYPKCRIKCDEENASNESDDEMSIFLRSVCTSDHDWEHCKMESIKRRNRERLRMMDDPDAYESDDEHYDDWTINCVQDAF